MRHKLVVRQLRRCFGVTSERDLRQRLDALHARGDSALADGLESFLFQTEDAYAQFERDLQVRARMLDISSEELTRANAQLRDAARDRLAAAEAAHRRILNSLREVVFQTDPEGNWVYLNPAWEHITGFPVEDTLGQRALWYVHREDGAAFFPRILALIAREEQHFREQMRFKHRDGSYRWLEVFARRIEDDAGANAGLSGSLIDITEQKLAQDQLIISEQRLHQALRATDSHLWDWDLSRPQPYVDPQWMASLGFEFAHETEVDWSQQVHPDDLARWSVHLREHLKRERPELDIELRFRMPNGEWRYTLVRGKCVAWDGARALRLAGTLQDISPRKEAEAAATRQQELTEQILDQLPIAVFLKDRTGRFVRFNRTFERHSHTTREQMLGRRIEDFASPGWSAITHEDDELAWSSGRMVTRERRLTRIDPPVDMLVNRIVINSGGESYLLGFSIDISEQRAARDAMQRAVEAAEA
ncbi:MAG TPA: PAS domain S-box protein, partial [Telluria sp.]|nr:PAS domain S-box protein [Telluria sp.]